MGHTACVKLLLNEGHANVHVKDNDGWSVVHVKTPGPGAGARHMG